MSTAVEVDGRRSTMFGSLPGCVASHRGGGFVVGLRLRPGQFGIGDGGCLGACLVVGAQDGDIDMLDGSWLHGFQVCGPASVANFRDDAGLGRVCFGASTAAVEGKGRRADHEALIAKRLVPPALPSEILEGCCHIIDKDLSVSILSSAIQPGLQDMHVPEWAPHGTFHSKAALLPPEPRLRPFPVPLLLLPLPASGCCSDSDPFLLVLSTRFLFS